MYTMRKKYSGYFSRNVKKRQRQILLLLLFVISSGNILQELRKGDR